MKTWQASSEGATFTLHEIQDGRYAATWPATAQWKGLRAQWLAFAKMINVALGGWVEVSVPTPPPPPCPHCVEREAFYQKQGEEAVARANDYEAIDTIKRTLMTGTGAKLGG